MENKKRKLSDEEIKQILIYLTPIILAVIFLFLDSTLKETKYHAKQSLVIWILGIPLLFIPFLNILAVLVLMAFLIIGTIKIVKRENPKIPGISFLVEFFEETFADLNPKGS